MRAYLHAFSPWLLAAAVSLSVARETASQQAPSDGVERRQDVWLKKRQEKSRKLEPYRVSPLEERIRSWEKRRFPQNIFIKGFHGFRPLIGGMPAGSGFVVGGGYISGVDSERVQFEANARLSTQLYRALDASASFPTRRSGSPVLVKTQAGYRDLTALNFFGLGNDSVRDRRSTFKMEDWTLGATLAGRATRFFEFGAEANLLAVDVGPGSREPSLEEIFPPAAVAGFGRERSDFGILGGYAEFRFLDRDIPPAGVVLRVEGSRYEDTNGGRFDFSRVVGELQAHVPLGPRNRRLAVRFRTSHSRPDAGQEVPFFLMETLGGAKSLRGFSEYRFRDRRNVVLNLEYRWEVWTYLDFAFFYDTGSVFSDPSDFDVGGLKHGYGFGIRGHSPGGMTFRIDFARSAEGFKVHIGSGPRF